jgi:hypothetical protein
MELLGAATLSPRIDQIGRMAGHAHLQDMAIESVFKDGIAAWLTTNKPPSLGALVVADQVAPGQMFTLYTNWFFKGLGDTHKAQLRGKTPLPLAQAYAKLDDLVAGARVEFAFSHEHLTSGSSWSELVGQKTKFVLGLVTAVSDGVITATPYVIADLAPSFDRPASLIGQRWPWKLEVFVDQIDNFDAVRTVERPRRKADLDVLRDIPEADVKNAFAEILAEPVVPNDWGGERSDFFTDRLEIQGQRISSAFAFKGPAKFKPMTMAELGKNGDQIDRLFTEPADLLVLQHCHEITNPVRGAMRAYAQRMGDLRLFCLIDGYETLRILRAYGKCGLTAALTS